MMNKRSVLVLSLFTTCLGVGLGACGDSSNGSSSTGGVATTGGSNGTPGSGGATATTGGVATAGSAGTLTGGGGAAGAATAGTAGNAGASGEGTAGGGGAGGSCDIPSNLTVFTRSDTEESWDDNDFSTEVLLEHACPTLVNVTWPHEPGWENADPAEANHEQTHFTLDSEYTSDLSNKQLSVTIELTADQRGPMAMAGGYIISLVSVSTWDKVVEPTGGAGGGGAGGVADPIAGSSGGPGGGDAGGNAGDMGNAGSAGSGVAGGGAAGGGGVAGGGAGGDSGGVAGTDGAGGVMTTTAYSEAETPPEDRAILRHVGDRATVTFNLPNKTSKPDSYDPTRVIKINVRIYSMYPTPMTMDDDMNTGGAAGAVAAAGSAGSAGSGTAGGGAAGTAGGGTAGDATAGAATAGSAGNATAGAGGGAAVPVFDYLTSTFAITNFSVKDVGAP